MRVLLWISALLGALVIAACGGSGAGSSTPTGNVPIFVTDGFRDDYSQVWVTVRKVEFRDSTTGSFSTAFASNDGVLLDARTLHDASGGLYAFMANGSVPDSTYNQVRVTLAPSAVLVPDVGTAPVLATITNPVVTVDASPPLQIPASGPVAIDFDLPHFVVQANNNVTAAIIVRADTGISDNNRHRNTMVFGRATTVTDAGFRLNPLDGGAAFNVTITDNTTITHGWNGSPATLHNGDRVQILGTFDTTANVFIALKIKVMGGPANMGKSEATGRNTSVNLDANTMVLASIGDVDGFVPEGSSVNVTWTDSTIFRRNGVKVDESQLNQFAFSDVRGNYDITTNTIAATRITLEDQNGGEGAASVVAVPVQVDLAANTAVLSDMSEIQGFSPPQATVHLLWTSETVFTDPNGNVGAEVVLTSFPTAHVRVEGVFNTTTNTLTASRIRVRL